MKLRYAVLVIAICIILYWSYSRIINIDNLNNNTEQMETKLDDMNTMNTKEETPIIEIEDDNVEIDSLDKRIIDYKEEEEKTITKTTETNMNDTTRSEPYVNNEDILDVVDIDYSDNIDSSEKANSTSQLFQSINRINNYNNELQSYDNDNVSFTDNKIIITSNKENKDGKNYTSGLVESRYAYLNGYYEFTIKMSYGKGIFPAIWLMPADYSSYPEVDIFEMIGSEPEKFYGVIHYINSNNVKSRDYFKQKVELKDTYKVALQWNTDELIWYIDDNIVHRTVNGIPNQYMYIIINQAVGGNWPGDPDNDTVFPSEFTIQDIKIKAIEQQLR